MIHNQKRGIGMRAEEGDETVADYAAQAAETNSRIRKSSQRLTGRRIAGIARRFAQLWKGEHGAN
jgi:hypothetical protein